jgi:predicted esterase
VSTEPAEHHVRVGRTARYYTTGAAAGADEIWIVCHGYAQLARRFIRSFEPIADATRLIVAPEALNRYYSERSPGQSAQQARVGATWMTREDREREIEDYVGYLDAIASIITPQAASQPDRRVRTVALGFSQGAATVSRWAARGAARIDHVVLWGAGIAHELVAAPALFRGAALTFVVGAADRHVREESIASELAGLRGAGVDATLLRYDGGHRIEAAALLGLADRLRG